MSEKKKQLIISISREYGAGGHLIAQILAEKLGLELVDADSIARYFADNHNFNYDEVMKYSGKPFNRIIHRTIQGHTSTLEENLSRMQFDYLRKKAADGDSFVIVGRCSETVLEDYDCMIAFFILAGNLMNTGGITDRIFGFARACVGHWPGGLGQVNILSSVIFSGFSA